MKLSTLTDERGLNWNPAFRDPLVTLDAPGRMRDW